MFKKEKLESEITHLAAEFLKQNYRPDTLVTVTRVELSENLKDGIVFFTTLPDNAETAVLSHLKNSLKDFKEFMRDKSKIGIIPVLTFKVDSGEKNRQKIDKLLQNNL